jgi:microcystin-dependent protein
LAETTTVNYGWTMPDPGGSPNTWGTTLNATTGKVDAKVYANEQGLSPIGAITMYAGAAAPANWLLCNGATLSRAAPYDKLFAILGTAFNVGTVAADKFMLPDLRQKYPLGVNAGNALGTSGGAFAVTLAIANMPSHAHTAYQDTHTHPGSYQDVHAHVITTGNHQHNIVTGNHAHTVQTVIASGSGATNGGAVWSFGTATTTTAGDLGGYTTVYGNLGGTADNRQPPIHIDTQQPAVTVAAAGSGTPFNVVPPFVALNYIVRFQ